MVYDFYCAPPTWQAYLNKLRELRADFPFLQIYPVGQSALGRKIYALSVGAPSPCTLFVGAVHAQEWLTCSLLIRFLEHLCLSLREKTLIGGALPEGSLSGRGLTVIPMLNPDGVSIALEGPASAGSLQAEVERIQSRSPKSWQANAHGVDLNHNFDAGFAQLKEIERENGITLPFPRQFGGKYPHSEPETRAIVSFLQGRHVETCYAFHSQGEEIYWDYENFTPARSQFILRLLCEASRYTPVSNAGLASHGGLKDYFIKRCRRPGFTIEIGRGENPLPVAELENIYARLCDMLVIAALV